MASFQRCITSFLALAPERPKQILSLGAGFDTAFFRLRAQGLPPSLSLWVEVDFDSIIQRKEAIIRRSPALASLASLDAPQTSPYRLVGADLATADRLIETLRKVPLDPNVPTLVILECVTVYLQPAEVPALLRALGGYFGPGAGPCAVLGYDPTSEATDRFGLIMIENLRSRGIEVPSLMAFPSCQARQQLLTSCGWRFPQCLNMNEAYAKLPVQDRRRVERTQPLDELEEFRLLHQHYVLWWGVLGDNPLALMG
ncbi:putative leucine carboxyl methyltransferase 1 [Paratrimastix pyriformis]|uniref:Leucine carboxyl methyltransferase 1 n=1 Tax=Paratrimastix pyriformis TaxID=342808 RepID=A0ABQ8U8S8_9EUKA|nr:putative leucine carboxyl methyltransferase 1 [Paratrimastix pyriformis]